MSFMKSMRIGVLAVIPAVAAACGNPTGPTPLASKTAAVRGPDVRVNLLTAERSGYVLASGRGSTAGSEKQ